MHVRVQLHETSFREQRCTMSTKTDTAMAVLAIVAATALYIGMTVHDKISLCRLLILPYLVLH